MSYAKEPYAMVHKTHLDALRSAGIGEDVQRAFVTAVVLYSLYGEQPEFDREFDGDTLIILNAMWAGAEMVAKQDMRRFKNGCRGGRPTSKR